MISQEYFDETLLESQELFDYDDGQAVEETVKELQQSASTGVILLDHLTLTHPNSDEGRAERQWRAKAKESVEESDVQTLSDLLRQDASDNDGRKRAVQNTMLVRLSETSDTFLHQAFRRPQNHRELDGAVQVCINVLSTDSPRHPLTRQLKQRLMSSVLRKEWCECFAATRDPLSQALQIKLARIVCNHCESNKKEFVQALLDFRMEAADGMDQLVAALRAEIDSNVLTDRSKETCLLLRVLGTFQSASEPIPQDGQEPTVSSAHASMLEFHKHGIVSCLHRLSKRAVATNASTNEMSDDDLQQQHQQQQIQQAELLSVYLAALRVVAIDNDMVQNMVAVGVLETVHECLRAFAQFPSVVSSALGLLRNLCANDEIKTSVCKSSLYDILHVLEEHPTQTSVQENGAGILAAMSLREPSNARMILKTDGVPVLVGMMERFPAKVTLQRQCALAVRNLASRLSVDEKSAVLNSSSVENVLRNVCAQHQGSVEEAFAALRDLGCEVTMYKVNADGSVTRGTEEFGKVRSNFRREYD